MLEVGTIADTLEAMAVAGGGTLDLSTGMAATHESGYYVGGAHGMAPHLLGADMDNLNAALVTAFERFHSGMDGSGYVGVWEDGGTIYVDATEWFEDPNDALDVAQARGELAIFDVANMEDIRIY